jgi:hypothetical protein
MLIIIRNAILALLFSIQAVIASEDIRYPIADIPDNLKANAKVVIRNWDQVFELKTIGKGIYTVSYAMSILNENGLDYAAFIHPYSQKLHRIHSIKGAVYDASGKKIENLVQDRIIDQSMIAGYSLYEDSRVKYFKPKTMSYPFTVEYSFVIELDGLLNIPDWEPVKGYNISVASSTFRLICPNTISIRYLAKNYTGEPEISRDEMTTTYEWRISQLSAFIEEPFSGPSGDFCPVVYVSSDAFEIEGYKGSLQTWKDFGKWINELNEGRTQLSPETVALLQDKTRNCTSEYEKARVVYEYMQQKTRYLNITVGIGGWQPIPAETVDRLGYGDCKALSNYTRSLLNAVGVKSYYTLIRAGDNEEEINRAFPTNNFNHAILCLPLAEDTLWLECTNQHIPFGYIGSFTDDRNALVTNENGGELIHTRSYLPVENRLERNSVIRLHDDGNASVTIKASHNGVLYDKKKSFFLAGTEDRKRMILDELNLPGTELVKFDYREVRNEVPAIQEGLEIDIPRFATLSGVRMIVSLVPVGRQRDIPKKVDDRKSDVVIRRSTISTDSITVVIPDGYQAESVPGAIVTESVFGRYSLSASVVEGNKILCVRKMEIRKGKHPAATYNELVDFYKKVAASDNLKVSLKRQI